jgi:hypothetical protein
MVLSQYGAMGKRKSIFLTKEEKDEALKRFLKKKGFSL